MTLQEIIAATHEMSYEDIRTDHCTPGTFANRVMACTKRYYELLDESKEHGYVGVGCITYAETQLDAEGYKL